MLAIVLIAQLRYSPGFVSPDPNVRSPFGKASAAQIGVHRTYFQFHSTEPRNRVRQKGPFLYKELKRLAIAACGRKVNNLEPLPIIPLAAIFNPNNSHIPAFP